MINDTLITSSGVIKKRSNPRAGIVNASSLYHELIDDCFNDGIDLTYMDFYAETWEQIKSENPDADSDTIEELVRESMEMLELDSHVFLLGAWVKNAQGKYEIDTSGKRGDYALEYNTDSGIICVEWSKHTTWCNNTSPCYVMADGSGPCGDLDSPGDAVLAYTLPADMFDREVNF